MRLLHDLMLPDHVRRDSVSITDVAHFTDGFLSMVNVPLSDYLPASVSIHRFELDLRPISGQTIDAVFTENIRRVIRSRVVCSGE